LKSLKKINVVTGPAYEHSESLKALIIKDQRFNHYVDVSDQQMKNLMLETDIAILPTSGLLFEAIACKARIIFGMYSENQQLLYNLIREAEHGIDAGQFLAKDIYNALENHLNFLFQATFFL